MDKKRTAIGSLVVSAAVLVGIAVNEGYSPTAYTPVKGDVATIGFGETHGVQRGDTTTPVRALIRLEGDLTGLAGQVQRCIEVPLYPYEYDAYLDLAYNIGIGAFCSSTLVAELHQYHYEAACKQILRWDRFHGKPLAGLTNRRRQEYRTCIGGK